MPLPVLSSAYTGRDAISNSLSVPKSHQRPAARMCVRRRYPGLPSDKFSSPSMRIQVPVGTRISLESILIKACFLSCLVAQQRP